LLASACKLGKQQASVCDIDIVSPGAELHCEELLRGDCTHRQREFFEEDLAGYKTVKVSLGTLVQPIFREAR